MKLFVSWKAFACLATLLAVTFVAGCGGGKFGGNGTYTPQEGSPTSPEPTDPEVTDPEVTDPEVTDPEVTPTNPLVVSTSPGADETGIDTNRKITASFDQPMDPETLDSFSFTLEGVGETSVTGAVSYDASTDSAIFTPGSNLGSETVYQATITTGATDTDGEALESDFVWQFTTGSEIDVVGPTITSTSPSAGATDVPLNRNVAATFSEDLDPASVTEETFLVVDAADAVVPGTVTMVGSTTAVFNPTEDFQGSAEYTATITTGVTDLADPTNPLAVAFVWSFKTGAAVAAGPAPVPLGKAGEFVILAKSSITTTGTTAIVGDLAISPAARSFMTGFDETLDASTEFATSSLVTGQLFAADMAAPTPSNLTTAVSNMETAYIDAAGRSNPDETELGAGDISGLTLEPGLYAWSTNLLVAADVTLSGSENDVWILQIAQDLTLSNGVAITLEGGALPENIFWQVAGQVTLGTTSDFKGVILSKTGIVLQTGAVLNGRALAQTAVTLDASAVTQPAQ